MRSSFANVVLGLLLAGSACAQAAKGPAFEVAVIKPNISGDRTRSVRPTNGHVSIVNMSVKNLITFAYNLRDYEVFGGPAWIDSLQYNIEAKLEGSPGIDQIRLMTQNLLADRFRLTIHRETREVPIYSLTLAKGGFKLKPVKEGDCVVFNPDKPPANDANRPNYCGNLSNGIGSFDASNATTADMARMFSYVVGRAVIDRAGVDGQFEVHMKYSPDETDAAPDPSREGPSIFTALQEQLGLRLEAGKGPVEVLVVQGVEQPTDN